MMIVDVQSVFSIDFTPNPILAHEREKKLLNLMNN